MKNNIGDMPPAEFREAGHKMIDWIADYLEEIEKYPVLSQVEPGDTFNKLPDNPPKISEDMSSIFADVEKIILPGLTHWNHPSFMAYFNSNSSSPGIFAELLTAAFNINGMLWKTSPAFTELEEKMIIWMRKMIGIDENFRGIIYDTASTSSFHAICCAKEQLKEYDLRQKGLSGRKDLRQLRIYLSEHAHSSIEKGAVAAGIGLDGIRKIPVDENFEMQSEKLEEEIKKDISNGHLPFCVVGTVGTTSTTSIDPVKRIGEIAEKHDLWFHVDAAHAGIAAIHPDKKFLIEGWESADSIVVNPHKWMFTPIDLSLFYTKKPEILKSAFSLVPDYLKTFEKEEVTNYMDYGLQLGRRFRSLKLWFIIRYFGADGIISRIEEHFRLAEIAQKLLQEDENFEIAAPIPLTTICFRAIPKNYAGDLNKLNKDLLENINRTGRLFLSHSNLNNNFVLRISISGLRTEERHIISAVDLVKKELADLLE